jgi:hypothetical protein
MSGGDMEWLWKALLTAAAVLLVMDLARRGGRRTAGMVAALPTVTAPALVWLAHDRGDAFASNAATAGVAACAISAAFSVVYAHVARRRGVATAMCCAMLAAVVCAGPVALASTTLLAAVALAVVSCTLAWLCSPVPPDSTRRLVQAPILATALTATVLAAFTVALAPLFGSVASGVLASLPLIGGAVAATEHLSGGHASAAHFLKGYVCGLLPRASYCATFAWLGVPLGWFDASLAAASCCGAVGLFIVWLRVRDVRAGCSCPGMRHSSACRRYPDRPLEGS